MDPYFSRGSSFGCCPVDICMEPGRISSKMDPMGDKKPGTGRRCRPFLHQPEKRRVIVEDQGKTLWESPENVLVQDFLWCDIDHDQTPELILLCWRIGRYGNARPFWVEHDELAWSQHIYIYDWRDEEIHALWMASDIGMDVVSFAFNDTDRLVITETNQRQTSWDWISWGLSFLKELAPAA